MAGDDMGHRVVMATMLAVCGTLYNTRCIVCGFVPSRDDVPRAASDAFRMKVIASKETGSAPPVKLVRGAYIQ